MNISHMSDEALLKRIWDIGKKMTDGSSSATVAMEKDRAVFVKEAFKRNLLGNPARKRYYR